MILGESGREIKEKTALTAWAAAASLPLPVLELANCLRVTAAMEPRVSDHVWSLEEIAALPINLNGLQSLC
jgi:hypothetical protein